MQPYEMFVDNELETQTLDFQIEKVINDNTNTLEGDVFNYYINIDDQCKIDDIEMDVNKVWSNWVFDRLIDLGFENVNIKSITIGFSIMNFEFNQIGQLTYKLGFKFCKEGCQTWVNRM